MSFKYHVFALILSLFFSFNNDLSGQRIVPEKSKERYVKYIKSIPYKNDKPNFLKRFNDLIFGKKRISIQKPMSIIMRSADDLWITDIGLKAVLNIQEGGIDLPKYIQKHKLNLSSPIGIASYTKNKFLFTDSYLGEVYIIDTEEKKVSLFKTGLKQPTGISYCSISKQVYVVETKNHQISVFDQYGELVRIIGKRGISQGEFNYPTFIWVDKLGIIYVIDSLNFRVQIFDHSGNIITVFGNQGDGTGNFARPKGIATDSEGNIFIADALFHAVQIFDKKGNFLYSFGSQGRDEGQFWMPAGIFIDENDFIYVADSYNSRIQVFKVMDGSYNK